MKNSINYFYNIIVYDIHKKNEIYYFYVDSYLYLLSPCSNKINIFYDIYVYLVNLNMYCHEIIKNKDNQIISLINEQSFCLLKVYYNNQNSVTLDNVLSYNIVINKRQGCNWFNLWCQKLDYYEYQMREYGKKYPLIMKSFSYYNGLCETAINYLKNVDNKEFDMYLNHYRISKQMTLIDFCNPLNFIIDVKVRDVCEFFKNRFFEGDDILTVLKGYLLNNYLNQDEMILLLARFLYPSYYFDMYDNILQGKVKEEKLYYYLSKIDAYEEFLKKLFLLINEYYQIPPIEWLIKT